MKFILNIIIASSLLFFSAVVANASPTHYGPVKKGESLWYIAYKYKPAGVTRWQMMRAIHIHNRSSFNGGDINLLQKGATLRIPTSKYEVTQFIQGTTKKNTTVSSTKQTGRQTKLKKAHAELKTLRDELSQSRAALNALKKESQQLNNSERNKYQQKIAKLEQENTAIKNNKPSTNSTENETLALKEQELDKAYKEVAALKKQNNLLKEQASTQDTRMNNTAKKDRLVSETIAALNTDIGQLRSRIKELEKLEQLKDAHIVELKKTLQHATKVIKDQDVINRKMHAQLTDLNMNRAEVIQHNSAVLVPKDNKQAGVAPPLSDMVKNVSPKFWLLLTLGGLLLVLSLLWRSLSQRNLVRVDDKRNINEVVENAKRD